MMINQIEPWIDEVELEYLSDSIKTKYVTEHAYTERFENTIRQYTNSSYAIAMTNGTAALYCAFKALGIGPGDEVIVPNITFVATANAVIMAGAKPIFCEIEKDYYCIDPKKAEKLINQNTKAIVPVHLYGQSANIVEICDLAKKHSLFVVEDAAQGMGVFHNNKHVGTFGDIGILSFYGNKTITCGEGGVILTESQELKEKCYRLKNHGRNRKGIFIHDEIGFNFSFTEMQAAVGLAQLTKLEKIIERKKQIHDRYVLELSDVEDICFCPIRSETTQPVFWFTSMLVDNRDKFQEHLTSKGIGSRLFFYPLNLQPCYQSMNSNHEDFLYSKFIYDRAISLPSSYHLTDEQQTYIINEIKQYYKNGK
jgi:perosamine synthetase